MKKLIGVFIVLITAQPLVAQRSIDGMIQAEKNFAAYAVAHSTKEAFLRFLDSNGIVFDNGKAVNGIESWNKKEKGSGILNWWPQFAEISGSKDFGYTTGPWTFRASAKDSIVARGQYTTVWHIDKKGNWKFLIDLGVSRLPISPKNKIKKINAPKQNIKSKHLSNSESLIAAENDFLELLAKDKRGAYNKYLSKESILNRNGHIPSVNAADQKITIDSTSSSIKYSMNGSGLSPGQDMGYTFGTTVLHGKTDNYQRIWRREKDGWKIALEVLRY